MVVRDTSYMSRPRVKSRVRGQPYLVSSASLSTFLAKLVDRWIAGSLVEDEKEILMSMKKAEARRSRESTPRARQLHPKLIGSGDKPVA